MVGTRPVRTASVARAREFTDVGRRSIIGGHAHGRPSRIESARRGESAAFRDALRRTAQTLAVGALVAFS